MDNFEDIKVGDSVIVHGFGDSLKLAKVTDVNKSTFKADGRLYNKKDGDARGRERYDINYCTKATPELISEINRKKEVSGMIRYLNAANYANLNYETLKRVYDFVKNEIEK